MEAPTFQRHDHRVEGDRPPTDTQLVHAQRSQNRPRFSWLMKIGLAAGAALSIASGTLFSRDTIDPTDYAARTRDVLSKVPLIDGHNDLPYLIRNELKYQIYNDRFTFDTGLLSQTDRKKLREGLVGGQFWSVYIHCPDPSEKLELDDPTVCTLYPLLDRRVLILCSGLSAIHLSKST
jgi:membrane dipeptidase